MLKEVWKNINIKNIQPIYLVSNYGRVFNTKKNKFVKPLDPKNEKGYMRVNLRTIDKKNKRMSVHRLVCTHFKPAKWVGQDEVNHIDGNKLNNNLSNLEWTTGGENKIHAAIHELYPNGEKSHKSTFKLDEVHSICKLFESGHSIPQIIDILNIGDRPYIVKNLYRIKHRKVWKSVGKLYEWDIETLKHRVYSEEDVHHICKLIGDGLDLKIIANQFPRYDYEKVLKTIRQINKKKIYVKISNKYF